MRFTHAILQLQLRTNCKYIRHLDQHHLRYFCPAYFKSFHFLFSLCGRVNCYHVGEFVVGEFTGYRTHDSARASPFFVHFFAVTARLRHETSYIVLSRFMEAVNTRHRFSFPVYEFGHGPHKLNSMKFRQHFTK